MAVSQLGYRQRKVPPRVSRARRTCLTRLWGSTRAPVSRSTYANGLESIKLPAGRFHSYKTLDTTTWRLARVWVHFRRFWPDSFWDAKTGSLEVVTFCGILNMFSVPPWGLQTVVIQMAVAQNILSETSFPVELGHGQRVFFPASQLFKVFIQRNQLSAGKYTANQPTTHQKQEL